MSTDVAATPVSILDELEIRPGQLAAFLESVERDYRPGAEARGMRLVHRWVTPPVEQPGLVNRVLLVWEVDGVEGFWRMRSQNAAPEVAAFWQATEAFVAQRTRRYAAEADALAALAAAGQVNA